MSCGNRRSESPGIGWRRCKSRGSGWNGSRCMSCSRRESPGRGSSWG